MPVGTVAVKFVGDVSHLKRSIDDVDGSMGKLKSGFSSLKSLALPGITALGGAAAVFGVSSVKAFADAQAAQSRLTDAFEKFPALADVSRQELDKLNESLALKTRFDDDATASSQAVLAQFGLTGKQVKALTPLVQDYAAKTGRDLPAAAEVLGKAILGQGRALKDIGLDFADTGSAAGNFDLIMAGLRSQVGGFAEKEGLTAQGKLEILKNRFGEVQEKVGEKLLPVLLDLSDWFLKTGIPAIETAVGAVDRFIERVQRAYDEFARLFGIGGKENKGGPNSFLDEVFGGKERFLPPDGRETFLPPSSQVPGWGGFKSSSTVTNNVVINGVGKTDGQLGATLLWHLGRVA